MSTQTITARLVFPVEGPPLAGGLVTISAEHIVAVESAGTRPADVDLGNAALVPGFVNAHTHLDLSGLRGQCPPGNDFTAWLRQVISCRRQQHPEQTESDIRLGLDECLRHGTTLIGDISTTGASAKLLREADVHSVVFQELLGLPPERAVASAELARSFLADFERSERCRPGLSPHAPYSVSADLLRAASAHADAHGVPLAIHLAESEAELQLLRAHAGPFVAFLEELHVWHAAGLASDPGNVIDLAVGANHPTLLVHGNYLDPAAPIPDSATIVYCPRTHAAFGHPPHPFRAFLERGVRVALGTDSLASNPDLDVLAEARFLARQGNIEGATLLRMLTLNGAEALGFSEETGSLRAGKLADIVVLPLKEEDRADPHELIFASNRQPERVMFRGCWRAR